MNDAAIKKKINFLQKPLMDPKKLSYIDHSGKVYINLYEIFLSKTIKFYQYPFKVEPEIESDDPRIRKLISGAAYKNLKDIFGEFRILGESLYCTKKLEDLKNVKTALYDKKKGKEEYILYFEKYKNETTLKQEDISTDKPLIKNFLEIIIKDILHSNPKLEYDKNIFYLKSDKKIIENDKVSVTLNPGFTTSFMETDKGHYLNVNLKNKIKQNKSILCYLKENYEGYEKNKEIKQKINEDLIGHPFTVSYNSKTYKISELNFDRNPENVKLNYKGQSLNLVEFHKLKGDEPITDMDQPIIIVKEPNGNNYYFVPELCSLSGLEDSDTKNRLFMQELAYHTKLEPNERVAKTNEFIKLLDDNNTDEKHLISAKGKKEFYGIKIKPTDNLFDAHYMKET